MPRELVSWKAGVGVPDLLEGAVRLQTQGAVWLWCDEAPFLLTDNPNLLGPVTAVVDDLSALEPGEAVAVCVSGPRHASAHAPAGRRRGTFADLELEHEQVDKLCRTLGPATIRDLAHRLAGLGPGLTPSGDDVLTGYLLTRCADGDNREEAQVILEAMGARSGEPALSLGRWAARGESFVLVLKARDALFGAESPQAISDLERLGSQTGRALIAGMAAGLQER
jgi:hypothetical protein